MAGPSPMPDPGHIETRLLVVAEMLERAVAEVRRAMAEVRGEVLPAKAAELAEPSNEPGSPDVRP